MHLAIKSQFRRLADFRRLAVCLIFSATGLGAAERPNIIFILCDDLGYGDVGVFYQNQRASQHDPKLPAFTTPQLDLMAANGMMLTRHYCAAPVCAPSRASLLTGLTQGNANVRDNQFDKALADTHTLGSVLKQAGYATAAIGKWGLQGGGEEPVKPAASGPGGKKATKSARPAAPAESLAAWTAYPTKRGFDFYYGYVRHKDGHFHYPKEDGREVWENDREVSADLDLCYTTDLFTARAKKWITDQSRENPSKPFFLYLAYDTPHAKLQNPPCAYPAGGGLTGGLQWTGKPHAMINTAQGEMDTWMHPQIANTDWPDVQKRYANGVRRIDDGVGDLLRLLADLKIADNTLVVFTSDNGPSQESYLKEPYHPTFFRGFGPFDGIKRDTMEGGMREPTIVRWPRGIKAGNSSAEPSGHWDWLATFAELAGVAPPAASDGVSLMPILTGLGKRGPGLLYSEYFNNDRTPNYPEFEPAHRGRKRGQMQVVFDGGYKGIRYDVKSADQDFEIFDVVKDPKESANLASKPGFQEVQDRMKARVLQIRTPDASAPRPYDSALVPALSTAPTTPPGVAWSLFQGEWPWMPDFRTLNGGRSGVTESISLSMAQGDQPFGVEFGTYFNAPVDGDYTFTLQSDGGAMLFIHDIRLIDEPKTPVSGSLKGSVRLRSGWHPLRLLYRRISSAPSLNLSVSGGSGGDIVLDQTNLRQMTGSK